MCEGTIKEQDGFAREYGANDLQEEYAGVKSKMAYFKQLGQLHLYTPAAEM